MAPGARRGLLDAARVPFVPAIAVMDRLSYARKFILIALLLAGPLAIVAYLQSSSATERIEFAQKERTGLALLAPASDFLCAAQRHRLLSAAVDAGASELQAALDKSVADADEALSRASALNPGALAPVKVRWTLLRTQPPGSASETDHAALSLAVLELLLTRVGNETNLVLDPDPDSYWLADSLVVKIPELAETVARVGVSALSPPSEKRAAAIAAGEELARSRASHLAEVTLSTAFSEAARSGALGPLEARVSGPLSAAVATVEEHARYLEHEIFTGAIAGAPLAGQTREIANRGLAALEKLQALSRAITPELDALLALRGRKYERQRTIGLAASGAAALVLAYLFIAIYMSVRASVRALEEAAEAEPGTPERFVAPGADELGQIAAAYSRARGEQLALREQLRRADKLATIGQLAAGTAHELNEPIAAILGFAQLAQKCAGLPEQADKDLAKIARAALHTREVIKQLLLFARQTPPVMAPTDLNLLVAESLEFLLPRCERTGVEVQRELAPDLPRVQGDAGQLRQVVLNLALNAIQATEQGGVVTVATSAGQGSVKLSVEDRGAGMSEEVRAHLFLPFYTTKGVGQGSGLGLSVVHGIVTAHRGTIEVSSVPGKGTRIEATLPVSA